MVFLVIPLAALQVNTLNYLDETVNPDTKNFFYGLHLECVEVLI